MKTLLRKLRWLLRRPDKEAELQEELQFHQEEEAAERQQRGLSATEAQRSARSDLGNVALVQEGHTPPWTWTFFEQFALDVRYGLRTIVANKTFSAMAILSLALGIGSQHGDLQLRGLPPAALAPCARAPLAGRAELAYPPPSIPRLGPA